MKSRATSEGVVILLQLLLEGDSGQAQGPGEHLDRTRQTGQGLLVDHYLSADTHDLAHLIHLKNHLKDPFRGPAEEVGVCA